jgi:hypothetical protein
MKHSLSGLPKAFMIMILISFFSLLFVSCGGGGDDVPPPTSAPTPTTTTGIFLDSPVDGATYTANPSGLSGTTQNGGEFYCEPGDTVDFSVGDVNLGEATCQETITPVNLVSGAEDETNPVVTNIARFLQSLDSDFTPSNGISINSATVAEVNGRNINITDPALDFDNAVDIQALFAALGAVPVTAAEAQDQLRSTLIGFTQDELSGKTYQVTENDYPTCVYDITFINDHQFLGRYGETVDFVIENGTMVISDPPVSTTISVLSRNDSVITVSVSVTGGSFEDVTDSIGGLWGSDFSSLNNSAIALKDLFIAVFWPGSTITADGRVANQEASFDGHWWINDNVFYFAYPEDDGCVDYKAYKLVNNRLMYATDADNTTTQTIEEKNEFTNELDSYYELYGAQSGDYNLSTAGHTLIGTSKNGNTFDVEGYDRFIIYVPDTSSKILFDAIGLDSGWVYSQPGDEYAHYTSNMIPIENIDPSMEGPPDGITIENIVGLSAYYGFTTYGASMLTVYIK